jgi:uncharacterized membrane protein YphA (DoxX/SURF4 family)
MLTDFIFDPVVTRAFASMLAIILLVGGWQKLRDIEIFAAAMENYRLLPYSLIHPVSRVLPMVEIVAGVALLFPDSCVVGAALAAVILLVVTAAVAINLARGIRDIDCGCGGSSNQTISWALVARNLVLVLLTIPAAQQGAGRSLYLGDYFTLAAGVLALVGLYLCTNQLLNNSTSPLVNRH